MGYNGAKMSDLEKMKIAMKNKVFLAAITGYAGAGLEPSLVISNAKDISDQVSVDEHGSIVSLPRLE
jgi:hypothetical protein